MSDSTAVRRRGRPAGSAPNLEEDEKFLRQAAVFIATGRSKDLTSAVRLILGKNTTAAVMRRLHRRWAIDRARYEEEAARDIRGMQAEIDFRAFEANEPELARRVRNFASTSSGKALLVDKGPTIAAKRS